MCVKSVTSIVTIYNYNKSHLLNETLEIVNTSLVSAIRFKNPQTFQLKNYFKNLC